SEPATMPTRQSAGRPRIARERSTTSTSRARPTAERCERPLSAPSSTAGDHPGRLAQGPEEKHGLPGRRFGFMGRIPLQIGAPELMGEAAARQSALALPQLREKQKKTPLPRATWRVISGA